MVAHRSVTYEKMWHELKGFLEVRFMDAEIDSNMDEANMFHRGREDAYADVSGYMDHLEELRSGEKK